MVSKTSSFTRWRTFCQSAADDGYHSELLDGLKGYRPNVVHFSVHAGAGHLFEDAEVIEPGDLVVGYIKAGSILKATDHSPTVIVQKACHALEGVNRMLGAAPVVIATSSSVGDASAAIFAGHFDGIIGAGRSSAAASDYASAIVAVALPDEPELAIFQTVEGIDPYDVELTEFKTNLKSTRDIWQTVEQSHANALSAFGRR